MGEMANVADDVHRGYGATAARLTPDQKVGSSNLSALTFGSCDPLPLKHPTPRAAVRCGGVEGQKGCTEQSD